MLKVILLITTLLIPSLNGMRGPALFNRTLSQLLKSTKLNSILPNTYSFCKKNNLKSLNLDDQLKCNINNDGSINLKKPTGDRFIDITSNLDKSFAESFHDTASRSLYYAKNDISELFKENIKPQNLIVKIKGPIEEIKTLIDFVGEYSNSIDSLEIKTYCKDNEYVCFLFINWSSPIAIQSISSIEHLKNSALQITNHQYYEALILASKSNQDKEEIINLNILLKSPTLQERLLFFKKKMHMFGKVDVIKIACHAQNLSNADLNQIVKSIFNKHYIKTEDILKIIDTIRLEKNYREL